MLAAKGNADNREAEQEAETEVREANPEAADANPEDVHHEREASAAIPIVCHRPSERPEGEDTELQRLQPERNADNRDHQDEARHEILGCCEQSTEK